MSVTAALLPALAPLPALAQDGGKPVYRCPGPPVLYTDTLSLQEARARGCRTIDAAPVTVISSPRPRPAAAAASRASDARVDPAAQRSRDNEARKILSDELQSEQSKLDALRQEYNNGQPERLGSERNYQRYLDRVAELKAAIERKQADIESIKRELAKMQ
ncbi:MAG: hypothetical protein KGI90_02635 [Burkholderiales bacterium]|nr:hypothetical protein [Burkholderiales bacterium]